LWLCFELVFIGRLSPSRTPRKANDLSKAKLYRFFGSPWSSRAPGADEERVRKGRSFGCWFFWSPYSSRVRREGEEHARRGAVRTPRVRARAKDGPCADRLRQVPSEGTPHRNSRCGAQSPGCPFFRFLSLGMQRKEPVVRGWVSRVKASVQWTLAPANGLATDGKHRTCKREHGERSAASPVINNRRQPQMALGTLAETKVPRLPGRDPANISRR
jgi:hypothetical protein